MTTPYCLNIHPGESLADIRSAIINYALKVKERVASDSPYPLGLRFSASAVEEFSDPDALDLFKELLDCHNLYTTGINGFPYGTFHRTAVKSAVYQPDWATDERVNYTIKLASILSALIPEGMTGNISTVPLGYKFDSTVAEVHDLGELYVHNIAKVADSLRMLHQETGKKITLAIEPEPDCVIENCAELIEWFGKFHDACEDSRDYIGVCLDTCHFAVEFEDPLEVLEKLEQADINIERIQLSSAISTAISQESMDALMPFIDPVYLHQTKILKTDGGVISYPDLTDATLSEAMQHKDATLRTHFHVPLFFEGTDILQSTHADLSHEFFAHVTERSYPLEIETYTFDVLPREIKPKNIIESLIMETQWVAERL